MVDTAYNQFEQDLLLVDDNLMISSALLHQLLQTAICFAEFETEVTETKGCRKARWRDQSKLDFAEYCGTNVLQGPSCCKSYVDSTCVWCFNWVRQRFSEDGAAPNLYRKKKTGVGKVSATKHDT